MSTTTGATSNAVFSVAPGDYTVEVRCEGYQQARDELEVSSLGTETYFMVMLRPADGATTNRAAKGTVMTPQLQKIVTKGLDAMRARDCDLAEKQFQKGVKMAPGNPDLAFLLGAAEFCLQHTDLARQNFERAVNLDPSHERALLSLGEMQLAAKETSLAIATLEKAQSVNASDWRVHMTLAHAYWRVGLRLKDAEAQAVLAVQLTNDKNGSARLLLGEIQYAQGNTAEARKTWQKLIDDLPSDRAAGTAKQRLESSVHGRDDLVGRKQLEAPDFHALEHASEETNISNKAGSNAKIARPSWPPPNADVAVPPIEPGATCNLKEVVGMAGQRIQEFVENVQQFTATEFLQHETINKSGEVTHGERRTYDYVVTIEEIEAGILNVQEYQSSKTTYDGPPQDVMNLGLPALLLVFHPYSSESFSMDCEGLTTLNGRRVWQVYFRQKEDQPNFIRKYRLGLNGPSYRIDLHGRAWFDATSFQIIRIQADLIRAIPEIQLTVDHTAVEYGPVNFSTRNIEMWVPQTGELFSERKGRRFHERMTFSGYLLFTVDDKQKISTPSAVR
jgi:TolA-binding protein